MEDVLEVVDLKKRYGDVIALDGASFQVPRGRLVGFLGPNGAGKTTAMRCMFGLAHLDDGEVRWEGEPVTRRDRRRFGYMPESRGLYPRMPVLEQVTYFGTLHGLTAVEARRHAQRWLERLGLADRTESRVDELSHGNQQRVQLAVAMAHHPDLLVLDEPFSGLDPIAVATMGEVVREEAERGAGVLFSSHQLDLVEDLCQDVVIIHRGRVVLAGALDAVRAASPFRYVEVNGAAADGAWIDGTPGVEVVERRDSTIRLRVPSSTDPVSLMQAAQRSGPLQVFRFEPPSLSDLFAEAVGS